MILLGISHSACGEKGRVVELPIFLIANIVITSKALATRSDALVPNSFLLLLVRHLLLLVRHLVPSSFLCSFRTWKNSLALPFLLDA